jgi:hypothetical protein
MTSPFSRRLLCGIVALGSLSLVGCNSSKPSTTEVSSTDSSVPPNSVAVAKTKLTQSQALTFSRMLYNNGQVGGGELDASFVYGPAATFAFRGDIDWQNAQGDMMLTTKLSDGSEVPPERILWNKGTLIYELTGLEEAMAKKGRPGVKFVARPIDKSRAALDLAITYMASLALTQPENPLLLRQDVEKYWYIGSADIRGIPVDQFGGGRSIYSADSEGNTVRVETSFKSMSGPAVIDFLTLAKKTIVLPPANQIINESEIPEIVAELRKLK